MSVLLFQLQHRPRLVSTPPFDGASGQPCAATLCSLGLQNWVQPQGFSWLCSCWKVTFLLQSPEEPVYLSQQSRIWPLAYSLTISHRVSKDLQYPIKHNCSGVNVMIVIRSRHTLSESKCSMRCSQSAGVVGCVSTCWHYSRRSLCALSQSIQLQKRGLPALGFSPPPTHVTPQSWETQNSSKLAFSYTGWQNWPSRTLRTVLALLRGTWQLAAPGVLARSEERAH